MPCITFRITLGDFCNLESLNLSLVPWSCRGWGEYVDLECGGDGGGGDGGGGDGEAGRGGGH